MTGLRREEVAMLAGVSVEYYTRLEKGNLIGVSDERPRRRRPRAATRRRRTRPPVRPRPGREHGPDARGRDAGPAPKVRPGVQRLLDSMTGVAAFVRNGRLDVLAANRLGLRACTHPCSPTRGRPANLARFVFLDPRARDFYTDWDGIADAAVGSLRAEAGRDPYDRALTDLVGELSMRSEEFRAGGPRTTSPSTAAARSLPPPPGRRPRPRLRRPGAPRRPRPTHRRLHRRTRLRRRTTRSPCSPAGKRPVPNRTRAPAPITRTGRPDVTGASSARHQPRTRGEHTWSSGPPAPPRKRPVRTSPATSTSPRSTAAETPHA